MLLSSYQGVSPSFDPITLDWDSCFLHAPWKTRIGAWFKSFRKRTRGDSEPFVVSPLHGRSACTWNREDGYVSIKGVGWTWGKPRVLRSRKDSQLAYGLLPYADAYREFVVGTQLGKLDACFATVLGFGRLRTIPCGEVGLSIADLLWKDGLEIKPAQLFVAQRIPLRVSDLAFLTDRELEQAINLAALSRSWKSSNYCQLFAADLGHTLASLHKAGGVNDSLEPGNVTLAAEVTDFEWLFLPGYLLPNGQGDENLSERQAKELIYAAEILVFLGARLRKDHSSLVDILLSSYTGFGGTSTTGVDDLSQDLVV